MLDAFLRIMVIKLSKQNIVSKFISHLVPSTCGLVPYSVKFSELLQWDVYKVMSKKSHIIKQGYVNSNPEYQYPIM